MSAVEQGEGLATVEDITVARLGIWLEVDDTSGWIYGGSRTKKSDLPKVFRKQDGKMFVSSGFTRCERGGSQLCYNKFKNGGG